MEIKYCGDCIHNDDGVCDKVGYFVKDTDMCICKKSLMESIFNATNKDENKVLTN